MTRHRYRDILPGDDLLLYSRHPGLRALHPARDRAPAPRATLAPFPPPPRCWHGAGTALRWTVRHLLAQPRAGRAPTALRSPRAEEGRT